jgi:hypothetical protein
MSINGLDLLAGLLIAHVVGDFFLQSKAWVADRFKNHFKSVSLYKHILVHLSLNILVIWYLKLEFLEALKFALLIAGTHYFIDLVRSYLTKGSLVWFSIDQMLHLFVILGIWLAVTDQLEFLQSLPSTFLSAKVLVLILAYLIILKPFSIVISLLIRKWSNPLVGVNSSLENAGAWIGSLERILILTFVLSSNFAAIGFLLAAKSILRFEGSAVEGHRKINEYILIGTLISFTMTILFGLGIKFVIECL